MKEAVKEKCRRRVSDREREGRTDKIYRGRQIKPRVGAGGDAEGRGGERRGEALAELLSTNSGWSLRRI